MALMIPPLPKPWRIILSVLLGLVVAGIAGRAAILGTRGLGPQVLATRLHLIELCMHGCQYLPE
jgi:hypothetical protein